MGIAATNIIKEFGTQRVLHGIALTVNDGDFLSISGRSGSGKSTLLHILSTLDVPTQGEVLLDGQDTRKIRRHDLDVLRGRHIGFIFQFHYLLPELTSRENILLPARNLGLRDAKEGRARELMELLDIAHCDQKLPSQMSGGEMQRVAIARALIMGPKYIFADEPTGNLDTYNAKRVMDILLATNQKNGTTVILVTHEPDFAAMAGREIFLKDGRIENERKSGHPNPVLPH